MRAPEFWTRRTPAASMAAALLSPVGWAYGASVAFKAARAKPYRSAARVLCVGNLTAGGTGKTPVVEAMARQLMARGLRAFILSRGYGGNLRGPALVEPERHSASEVGDEPLMLATTAPTIVSRDRIAGAKLAESHGADVILMDDGHQNFSLAKDLSVVVVDSREGFGNGRVLPAGPLREPASQGLGRANAIILMGEDELSLAEFLGPILRARIVSDKGTDLAGQRVLAFAGIGRPQKFFDTLRRKGAAVIETHAFPDHYFYGAAELAELRERAKQADAILITTEKDFVRLSPLERREIGVLRVRAMFDDPDSLARLMDTVMPSVSIAASS